MYHIVYVSMCRMLCVCHVYKYACTHKCVRVYVCMYAMDVHLRADYIQNNEVSEESKEGAKLPVFGGIPGRWRKPYMEENIDIGHCNLVSFPDCIFRACRKNRSGQLPIPFSFKCAEMLAYCSFLI